MVSEAGEEPNLAFIRSLSNFQLENVLAGLLEELRRRTTNASPHQGRFEAAFLGVLAEYERRAIAAYGHLSFDEGFAEHQNSVVEDARITGGTKTASWQRKVAAFNRLRKRRLFCLRASLAEEIKIITLATVLDRINNVIQGIVERREARVFGERKRGADIEVLMAALELWETFEERQKRVVAETGTTEEGHSALLARIHASREQVQAAYSG